MLLVVRVVVSVGSTPPKNKLKGKGNRFRFHIYVVTFFQSIAGLLNPHQTFQRKGYGWTDVRVIPMVENQSRHLASKAKINTSPNVQ